MGHYQDIDIILNDIKELYEMVKGLREEENIPRFIIKLTDGKVEKIKNGLNRLSVSENNPTVQTENKTVQPDTIDQPIETMASTEPLQTEDITKNNIPEISEPVAVPEIKTEETPQSILVKEKIVSSQTEILNESIEKRLIVDVRKALSLNDRFRFQRELFNNDAQYMNRTLDQIGSYTQLADVLDYLKETFHWDKENTHATDFIKIVIKKFS